MPALVMSQAVFARVYLGRLSTDAYYPFYLLDSSRVAVIGKVYTDLTIYYAKGGDTSWTTYTIAAADLKEIGSGQYWLNMGLSEFTNATRIFYNVLITCLGAECDSFTVDAGMSEMAVTRITYQPVSTDFKIVVRLENSDGEPFTGKLVGDITCRYFKSTAVAGAGTSAILYSPAAGDWVEVDSTNAKGEYTLNFGATETTSEGIWELFVSCAGCVTRRFIIFVGKFSYDGLTDTVKAIQGREG